MNTGDHGQPRDDQKKKATDSPATTDAAQDISVNTQQAAAQLGVDSRTVRRYITDGIRVTGGTIVHLQARQVQRGRGPEWQIYQSDLDAFKEQQDRAATEGGTTGQLTRTVEENQSQSQALTTSIHVIAEELERRSLALSQAQDTIERLAHEAGRQAGRSEVLERELEAMRRRVTELEQERDHWQQQAQEPPAKTPRRVRLLPWQQKHD